MKKLLIVLICALSIMLSACDDKSASDAVNTTVEEETTATNYVIDEISGIEGYSYIGAGAVTETESNTRSVHSHYGKKILGIRKSDGKAEPVKFKNKEGNEIPSSPSVTAELVTEKFNFYKLSYDSSDYYETDFVSAPGDLYCIESSNGAIYKLDGITGLYAERGNYDYYDGLFVGSFIFEDGTEYLCKVYMDDTEIKIDKKIDTKDFPEFKQVFMDRNKNIFACAVNEYYTNKESANLSYIYMLKFILSNSNKLYKMNDWVILGFNRVVYSYRTAEHLLGGETPEYSNVKSYKEYLYRYIYVDGKYTILDNNYPEYYDTEELNDGTIKFTVKEGSPEYISSQYGTTFIGTPYYKNLDLAYTTDFYPPELINEGCWHGDPYHNWYYSELLDVIDDKYIYITKADNYYGIIVATYSDSEHMKYELDFTLSNRTPLPLSWVYGEGKVYYFKDGALMVLDIATKTSSKFENQDIIKYHSIEKVNNDKVGFQGTNSDAEKVYYEIDPKDDSITLIGVTPTYSSVSFKPINQ